MASIEEALLERMSGRTILRASVAIGIAGTMPLVLYLGFGPKDGNPLGLGLLAVAAVVVASVGTIVGAIKILVNKFDA
jgi:hypothetical protein